MTICKRVQYRGRVQGVGFRYTAQFLAEGVAVAGYVRNLPNGDVELLAEGSAEDVDRFLGAVAQQMAEYVVETTVQEQEPSGLKGFRIRY
jgi:acylphosphatase